MRVVVAAGFVAAISCLLGCGGENRSVTAPSLQGPPFEPPASPPSEPAQSPLPGPAGYSVAGTVREVNGGPIAGVRVRTNPPAASTTTNDAGAFSFADITHPVLVFERSGFRFNYWTKPENATTAFASVSIKMQPLFTLSAESGVSSVISGDDLTYSSDRGNSFWEGTYFCEPCKEISVRPVFDKAARLRLHWSGPTPLDLWAGVFYGGVTNYAAGNARESQLVLDVPPGIDTLLVGAGSRGGVPQRLAETVSFDLTIEAR